ncbi:2-oxo acid dehydrogenase subunit E2 [Yoonia sp.]|uniref:2-oxo acid dehydrogenase subunit E2 n=1 Tax=Yoonia sp. TaxID=2212373 RepID=UPI00358E62EB
MTDVIASPSVRTLAGQKGIDLEKLARDLGRTTIAREDLTSDAKAGAAQSDHSKYWDVDHGQFGPVTEEPLSRFAQVAAGNLGAANNMIPQVTHHDQADVSAIEALRKELKPEAQARSVKLTALAFQVKALARALREFPRFNASLTPDGKSLVLKNYVHIGIAVDTAHGLMVPVIRDADRKGLWQIAAEITDLATRAQARKVGPDEMGGASMSISNLGGIGGTAFTPIVNPPEVAILGLTRTEIKPVWDGESFQPVPMVPLDLSYDHRVINGAEAARFVSYLAGLLGDPRRIMI